MTTTTSAVALLSESSKAYLEKANYSKDKNNIPNVHKAVKADQETLKAVCEEIGIDYEATAFTVTVAKTEKGINYYLPYVGNHEGKAAIFWGGVRKPLAEISAPMMIEEDGKRLVLEVELSDGVVHFGLMMPKEGRADKATARKALRQGNLHEVLAKSFDKPKKLSDLTPGTYHVINYKTVTFKDEVKYLIELENQGWFNTNTKLRRKLANNPVIDPQHPAILDVAESFEKTATGYPIIPVELTTIADFEIEVFDF